MCGIIGYNGQSDRVALDKGLRTISHRGPDDAGVYFDAESAIGLGHTRLSILDLSPLGHQPMLSTDGTVAMVFNGEIYNYRELRSGLVSRGVVFKGTSDTEVLLNLYLAEGESMLRRLNGIFAFAVWDALSQAMVVARDALGVKPFYYAALDGRFAFASEIKALLHLVPELKELDAGALHRYLSFLWCPGEGTPLRGVRKLLPGEAMEVRFGQIARRWQWYRPPVSSDSGVLTGKDAVLEGTLTRLRDAVHRQMVADVPVGAFLSGGLDSSAVVALARKRNPDIRCFTIEAAGWAEEGATDDLPFARTVAAHLGVPLESVPVDAGRMAGDLERMVAQLDEPLADPAPLNVLYISRLARERGIKVLLSGAGGDDLFTGYRRHRAVMLSRFWSGLPRAARKWLAGVAGSLDRRRPWARRASKLFGGAALDGDPALIHFFRWSEEAALQALYSPEFRAVVGGEPAAAPMLEYLEALPEGLSPLERMLALEQRFFLADHNLIYTDKMSMAAGVEVRVPFLDLELVDHAARIPVSMKQRGGEGKWVLKKIMEPYLPRNVIYRPKSGFGAPLRRWMRHDLRELMGDLLSAGSLRARGLFDPAAVRRLIEANESGRTDAAYTLLSLLCIEIWCRTYLDRQPSWHH